MRIKLESAVLCDNSREFQNGDIFIRTQMNEKYLKNLPQNAQIIAPAELKSHLLQTPKIIAITGTNGKTTTAGCIYSLLLSLGFKAALCGTRGVFINDKRIAPKNLTTPLLLELYYFLHLASLEKCDFFVMEASSHAIAQARIEGLNFALKILTNLQSDHLDFHKTREEYLRVKNSFFADSGLKLINKDCAEARFNHENAYFYGIENASNLKVEAYSVRGGINAHISWSDFRAKNFEQADLQSALFGKYNLYNLIAAIAAVRLVCEEIPLSKITDALNEFGGVQGRMEIMHENPLVVVDFAHTAEGMQNIFEAFLGEKIKVVFGAGGNRDKTKRPKMGRIAEIYAQKIYLTNDNPRDENPREILNEIRAGMKNPNRAEVIEDRKDAILSALDSLKNDEILLILGKGDEDYQIIGAEKFHFDDREIVREFYRNL